MLKLPIRVVLMIICVLVGQPVVSGRRTIFGTLARLHVSTIFCNVLLWPVRRCCVVLKELIDRGLVIST